MSLLWEVVDVFDAESSRDLIEAIDRCNEERTNLAKLDLWELVKELSPVYVEDGQRYQVEIYKSTIVRLRRHRIKGFF